MSHVFGRQAPTLKGVFAADLAVLTLSQGLSPTLVQNMNMTYAQQISRFFEIGGSGVYYVGGRSSGQLSVGHLVGPGATILGWYSLFGDVCNAKKNRLQFTARAGACDAASQVGLTYDVNFVVLTQLGVAIQAQDVAITENSQAQFLALEVSQAA